MKTNSLLLAFALTTSICRAESSPVFDVRDHGAKGDGVALDTAAIQKALDACGKAGGGTVRFPAGTYLSQPIILRTKTTVQLEEGATLLATTNHADFMKTPGDWLKAASGGDFIPLISGKDLADGHRGKGTSPTFQWQVSTNSGTTWNNVTGGIGGTSQNYQTPVSTPADNGKQYRVIATIPCNGTSATSAVATVTVVNAVATPVGVVVDDAFMDGYNNLPYGISNSVWFSSDADSLNIPGSATSMLGTTPASSVTWLGYFTDDSVTNLPVHLQVGRALRGTLVFKASNIVSNGGSLRIGFFDYADGSTRIAANGFGGSPPGSTNVLGYMTTFNFGTNFTGNPFSLFARNVLTATDLMGTTANYLALGSGPANYAGLL